MKGRYFKEVFDSLIGRLYNRLQDSSQGFNNRETRLPKLRRPLLQVVLQNRCCLRQRTTSRDCCRREGIGGG
ncbi:hypothetical protein C1H46_022859 [Malus baccata]|uniref:Uncharacterized protein n=1 Tax=Malus baccata TaxID=106549 RepID=A0A540LYJ2_MALBA|nr:hypothetical protein C1H46_022859 [Malus baccata]